MNAAVAAGCAAPEGNLLDLVLPPPQLYALGADQRERSPIASPLRPPHIGSVSGRGIRAPFAGSLADTPDGGGDFVILL